MDKKIYRSGKMHGVHRCEKRNEIAKRIPSDNTEKTDITGIILSGIKNYGANSNKIAEVVTSMLDCEANEVKIKYDTLGNARQRFLPEIIEMMLNHKCDSSVDDIIHTFYDFVEMPTETTRNLWEGSDVNDVKRYLSCETRTPINVVNPFVSIDDFKEKTFINEGSFLFSGHELVRINERKEGRKKVYDEIDALVVEFVKIIPTKPAIRQSSSKLDESADNRIELYIMLKAAEKWYKENSKNEKNVLLKASYYYLKKNTDKPEKYNEEFFGAGGNTPSLSVWLKDIKNIDNIFKPIMSDFISGCSVDESKCKDCKFRALCKDTVEAVPENDEHAKKFVLNQLSKEQLNAVNALDGNIRVIATAGSGKTTVMTYRIGNLLKHGVKPEEIGCFTFTNTGAEEMRDRIHGYCEASSIDADVDKITISTIHSFGDSLLKRYYDVLGYSKPPVLINEIQRTKIIENILQKNPPIKTLINKYQNFYLDLYNVKGILESMKVYFNALAEEKELDVDDGTAEEIKAMYAQYIRYKKEMCLIEYSDQELGVLELLKIKPNLFEEVGIKHISVDEFQDTSYTQFEIIKALKSAKGVKSLFVVGDDDQSIYGFRDADVSLICDFDKKFNEEVKDFHLMSNRRSTSDIVNFASKLIQNNENRIEKSPVSTKGKGSPVRVIGFDSTEAEIEHTVEEIKKLLKNGVKEKDIAILTATNAELEIYSKVLAVEKINTVNINPEPILENKKVIGAISFVKFMMKKDMVDAVKYLTVKGSIDFLALEESEKVDKIEELKNEVAIIDDVETLLNKFIDLDTSQKDEIYQAFLKDIETAQEDSIKCNNIHKVCEYIIDFERFGKKQTARREGKYDGVTLSTMHSSKGKEWPIVFVSISKLKADNDSDLPEKRRLLFVACTRAMSQLIITGTSKSLFLDECLDTLSALS